MHPGHPLPCVVSLHGQSALRGAGDLSLIDLLLFTAGSSATTSAPRGRGLSEFYSWSQDSSGWHTVGLTFLWLHGEHHHIRNPQALYELLHLKGPVEGGSHRTSRSPGSATAL